MAVYLSLPILDEAVRLVEADSTNESSVNAMANGIFNYYFSAVNNYMVAPKKDLQNSHADFVILHIKPVFPGCRGVNEHTIAKAKGSMESLKSILDQLDNALEHANTPFQTSWAIVIHGALFNFYEYHRGMSEQERLLPFEPPAGSQHESRDSFHARNDSVEIDWMLRHMGQNDPSLTR